MPCTAALRLQALLHFVCDMAQRLASPKAAAGRVAMSFYAVTLCEALAQMKTVRAGSAARAGPCCACWACCRASAT